MLLRLKKRLTRHGLAQTAGILVKSTIFRDQVKTSNKKAFPSHVSGLNLRTAQKKSRNLLIQKICNLKLKIMNMIIKSFLIILTVFIISCKNQNNENELPKSDQNEIVGKDMQEIGMEKTKIEKTKIIEQLQGKWKENEYPYRTTEFLGSTVKFVEEGTETKPKFEKFEISEDCPFDNNNIRVHNSSDIILSLPETKRCEKLKVSPDSIILSGFSTNTNEDYNIIYKKIK